MFGQTLKEKTLSVFWEGSCRTALYKTTPMQTFKMLHNTQYVK